MWTFLLLHLLLLSWKCCSFSLHILSIVASIRLFFHRDFWLVRGHQDEAMKQHQMVHKNLKGSCSFIWRSVFWEIDLFSILIPSELLHVRSTQESLFTATSSSKLHNREKEASFRQWVSEWGRTTSRTTHERALGKKETGRKDRKL